MKTQTIYLNMRGPYGVETVDQLTRGDFPDRKKFICELRRLIYEYNLSGMPVYSSRRCTNDWKR